jgi:hypothetical protein
MKRQGRASDRQITPLGGSKRKTRGSRLEIDENNFFTLGTVDNENDQIVDKRAKKPYEVVMEKFVVALSAKS